MQTRAHYNITQPYNYGTTWSLKDKNSAQVYLHIRNLERLGPDHPVPDPRKLDEVGIAREWNLWHTRWLDKIHSPMTQIRICRPDDFDGIVVLLRQLWADKTLNPSSLRPVFDRALVSGAKVYLCAVDGEKLVGFGSLTIMDNFWPEGSLAYIDELVVDSEF